MWSAQSAGARARSALTTRATATRSAMTLRAAPPVTARGLSSRELRSTTRQTATESFQNRTSQLRVSHPQGTPKVPKKARLGGLFRAFGCLFGVGKHLEAEEVAPKSRPAHYSE